MNTLMVDVVGPLSVGDTWKRSEKIVRRHESATNRYHDHTPAPSPGRVSEGSFQMWLFI